MHADPSNYRTSSRSTYARVVIHCTDGHPDPRGTAQMWQTKGHGSSAHLVVGQDATIIQAVLLSDIAWHAHSANTTSVGIEHCARTPGSFSKTDPGMPPTAAQLEASAKLTAWLLAQCGLPADRCTIVGHAEADPETTHADCPTGCGLDLNAYAARVRELMQAA